MNYTTSLTQTYIKILRARGNSTKSYVIIRHVSTTRICGKSDCTPASGFASHADDQHVAIRHFNWNLPSPESTLAYFNAI